VTLLEEAAIEIESVADEFRASCVVPGTDEWPDEAERAEYNRLMDLVRRLREEDRRPDPLGEALNSGDGTYRP